MQTSNTNPITTTPATGIVLQPWVIRPLPVIQVKPVLHILSPLNISDAVAKKAVDNKMNAALKNLIKAEIDIEDEQLEARIDALKLDYRQLLDKTVFDVISTLVIPALERQAALAYVVDVLRTYVADDDAPLIRTLLDIDTPLDSHPLFVADVRRSKGTELLRISKISTALIDRIDTTEKQLEAWNLQDWQEAVNAKIITPAQQSTLFFHTEISRISGEQYDLVDAASTAGLKTVPDLVKWGKADWLDLIKKKRLSLPAETSADTYAELISKNIQETWLPEYFAEHIIQKSRAQSAPRLWKSLQPLLKNNPQLMDKHEASDIDWTSIKAADKKTLQGKLDEVFAIINTYRHLGLRELLSGKTTLGAQETEIGRRIDALAKFFKNNAGLDIRLASFLEPAAAKTARTSTDTGAENELNWSGIAAADKTSVSNQLMAYQRVLHLSDNSDTAMSLLRAGFDASTAISKTGYTAFAARTGIAAAAAKNVYHKATARAARVANGIQLKKDAISSMEQDRYFQGVNPAFLNDLKDIAGYADLFGSTGYCECEHCRSIFSPAAYFADLMHFIETRITKLAFVGKKKHPLRLNMRRPDLWTLPLSCANTDTLIPQLTLVNEILESYLKYSLNISDSLAALAADRRAINLPYHHSLTSVRTYLGDWNTSLAGVYQLLHEKTDVQYKEVLGLSDQEWTGLTASGNDITWIHFDTAAHTTMDVTDFLRYLSIGRNELDELRKTTIAGGFTITKVKLSDDIQSEKEVVSGLSDNLLNLIGRFLRLRRSTGFTITELDEILLCKNITQSNKFSAASLSGLARFMLLQQQTGLAAEELIAVLNHIPVRALKQGDEPLAEKTGLSGFAGTAGFPVKFHHAHFNTDDAQDSNVDPLLPALLSLLGVNDSELLDLFKLYADVFPFTSKGLCTLTADNLCLLYAHVKLSATWQLNIAELALLLNEFFNQPSAVFRSLDELEILQGKVQQLKRLPFSVEELLELQHASLNLVTEEQVTDAVQNFQQSGAYLFNATVLTALNGITTTDANQVIDKLCLAGLLLRSGDKFALTETYLPLTDISAFLPAGLLPRKDEIHNALLAFHVFSLLPNVLAATTGIAPEMCIAGLAFVPADWEKGALLKALLTPISDGLAQHPTDLAPLIVLSNQLYRAGIIFDRYGLQVEDAWFVALYPSVLAVNNIQQLSFDDLEQLLSYKKLVTSDKAEMQNLLWQYQVRSHNNAALQAATVFPASVAKIPVFAKALGLAAIPFLPAATPVFLSEAVISKPFLNEEEIAAFATQNGLGLTVLRSVFLSQDLPKDAVGGMMRALELYNFCSLLRIQGQSLPKLLKRDVDGLAETENLLLNIFSDKYADAATYDKHISPYTEKLNMSLRDALCDFIIARADLLNFKDREDLYNYFLIDVEMGGCFETSRLVAAISSLQQYISRCLVDLEQSKKDNFSVLTFIDSVTIASEWEWRKNYRVWEANRKVFLYPESYIEPDLRDNKTPLFKELEENLLQQKITLDSAEEAYTRYITGYSELAQLKICGACYDDAGGALEKQAYYFVGRTHRDPYQYYYRRYLVAADSWEAWQRIDLSIASPYVSPIIYRGRLYLFWGDVTTTDKTGFLDGNSVFQGIEHQVTVQYSHLAENGKWTVAQKKPFPEKFLDRYFIDTTPPFLRELIKSFMFLSIDKAQTKIMADAYRGTKTFTKIFVTYDDPNQPEMLTVHYYRERAQSNICVYTETGKGKNKVGHYKSIAESQLNDFYVVVNDGKIVIRNPKLVPAYMHFRKKLDLVRNEFGDSFYHGAFNQTAEGGYYNASKGVEAIGIFTYENVNKDTDFVLNLRNYAVDFRPATSDSMLISDLQRNGTLLSSSVSMKNVHDIFAIGNKQEETILQVWKSQHWIRKTPNKTITPAYTATRINTTLDGWLSEILFTKGLETFLTYETQSTKGELQAGIDSNGSDQLQFVSGPYDRLPLKGSFGEYYRELFFHIPFLIANQLNSEGQYREAKHWYEKIFNPTAKPVTNDSNEKHRVWQYIEFRDQTVPKLKDLLSDKKIIHLYESDPFNPHAIARLRMSAYQKSIVMKYVDNLIDWADDLFSQDTMESINEATMLYVLAQDILGKRPVSTGACESGDENTLTYSKLEPEIDKGSDFLMYAENLYLQFELESQVRVGLSEKSTTPGLTLLSPQVRSTGLGNGLKNYRAQPRAQQYQLFSVQQNMMEVRTHPLELSLQEARPEMGLIQHYIPEFCVPPNENLLAYWDRIADRLFKIRNCMNINGERRSLALFQPPIDPMLLVRAKAMGLSIEAVFSQLNEALPPYRFSYFVEKARQYLGTVQSFGSALLSALEKKDGETLTLLRSVHEQNILSMTRSVKKQQIVEANTALQGFYSTQQNVQNRVDYYGGLISAGLNGWETMEQVAKHTATSLKVSESVVHLMAGITYLIPEVGSPFAMTYGGGELGDSGTEFAQWTSSMASVADAVSGSAGLEATFKRRSEEWGQQLKLAQEELNQVSKQILAAEIRVSIAEKDLEIHEKQIDQAQELHDFYKNKFTSYGLYNYMATQLGRLYREAYQMAAQLARQAERAFQFERDSSDFFIQGDNWQSDKSGLLSGERLLLQLQRLEKAYMEQNYREMEMNQSFSLQQFNPQALQDLKRNGTCSFDVPEILFDMYYPGQYRRLIKAVRVTMPCVAGPYTNIGAKLTLNTSKVRRTPQASATPDAIPVTMVNSIATSQAQNDAGVFELNFRDERYLPFEGAGAISNWTLDLPSKVRMFNYDSLSDVIIHISYVAKHDDAFGHSVETNMMSTLKSFASVNGLSRVISLRHEFPDTFYQLMNGPDASPQHSSFVLESKHFPAWLSGLKLKANGFDTWLKPVKGQTMAAVTTLKINNKAVNGWSTDGVASVTAVFDPQMKWDIDAAAGALSKTTLDDIVLLVKYELDPSNP